MNYEQVTNFLCKFGDKKAELNETEQAVAKIYHKLSKKYRFTFQQKEDSYSVSHEALLTCCEWTCTDFLSVFENKANELHKQHLLEETNSHDMRWEPKD